MQLFTQKPDQTGPRDGHNRMCYLFIPLTDITEKMTSATSRIFYMCCRYSASNENRTK